MEQIQKIEKLSKDFPQIAGVYIFWHNQVPIYIGKAKNLRNRIKSYFDNNLLPKTKSMILKADNLSYIKVQSELESLLLEAKLIKKYKPKYNIVLKDDKHPLYIVITKDKYPRILSVRKIDTKLISTASFFGPFPSSSNVKYILKFIRKIFPYSEHKIGKKPCLYWHIGLCNPCPNVIESTEDYQKVKYLTKAYKTNIKNIQKFLSGRLNTIRVNLVKNMYSLASQEKFEYAGAVKVKIQYLDYITQKITKTQDYIENPNFVNDLRHQEIKDLTELINKENQFTKINYLKRIECFDIAHLQGSSPTASMVVAIDGEIEKNEYRHFKIRQKKSQSDYDSMREIAQRRLNNINKWGTPDLIIVDGGIGQVKIFREIITNKEIIVVGIAKNPDRLVFPNGSKIRLTGNPYRFVTRIRDEAHRFARRYHHSLLLNNYRK